MDKKVDAEYTSQYLGNNIWIATKTCPLFDQYNGYWYFYEDVGQFAPKWLSAEGVEQSSEETTQAVAILEQRDRQVFNNRYANMKKSLENAYTLDQQLQKLSWFPLENLSWTSKDDQGNEQSIIMKDVLPSTESLQPLLLELDKCNALAAELWLENPYQTPANETGKHLTTAEWYSLSRKLISEISKAEDQAGNIKSDTDKKLAYIDKEFSTPGVGNESYIIEYQSKRGDYSLSVDDMVKNLQQSKLLALKIRYLTITPNRLMKW